MNNIPIYRYIRYNDETIPEVSHTKLIGKTKDIALSWRNHTQQVEHCLLCILIHQIIHVHINTDNDLLLSFSLLRLLVLYSGRTLPTVPQVLRCKTEQLELLWDVTAETLAVTYLKK